jgi:hypothetical protein
VVSNPMFRLSAATVTRVETVGVGDRGEAVHKLNPVC